MLTSCGPRCDVCGDFILFDASVNPFTITGIGGTLLSHDLCKPKVLEACQEKNWKLLPSGPLRLAFEEQEMKAKGHMGEGVAK